MKNTSKNRRENEMKHLQEDLKDFLLVNGVFIVICIIVLIIPLIAIGPKFFILVILYNVLIPSFSIWKGYNDWINIWLFSIILSIFQIFPDWFLSAQLNVLVFPEDGFVKIGSVSGYMAGLWAIPFFTIIFFGLKAKMRYSEINAYLIVGLVALLLFGGAELTLWGLGSWYAQNVVTIFDHIAVYILIPETMLGLATFYYFNQIKEKPHIWKIPIAFLVMLIYLGAAAFFYFLFESLLFNF
jgi:hypothetical protein